MQLQKMIDGNWEMSASPACIKRIRRIVKLFGYTYAAEAAFLADELQCRATSYRNPMQQTAPCSVGALTGAPMFTDGIDVWAYMDYQVMSFMEELAKGNKVIWTKG